jgi:hypothetical protein
MKMLQLNLKSFCMFSHKENQSIQLTQSLPTAPEIIKEPATEMRHAVTQYREMRDHGPLIGSPSGKYQYTGNPAIRADQLPQSWEVVDRGLVTDGNEIETRANVAIFPVLLQGIPLAK